MTSRALISKDTRRLRLMTAWLALCLCAAPLTATAQSAPGESSGEDAAEAQDDVARVEALSEEGAAAFGAGDFTRAIALFEEAYTITPVANLLYNIALCHERLNDPATAARYYKQFILAPDADAEVRAVALARMEEIEQATRGSQVGALNGGDAGATNTPPTQPQSAPKSQGLSNTGTIGIVTAGAGALLLGAGGVFGVLALNDQDDFDRARDPLTKAQAQDNAETKALTADILMGAGAAALITGTVLLVIDLTGDSETNTDDSGANSDESVRWRPVIGPQGVGAVLEVPFTGH